MKRILGHALPSLVLLAAALVSLASLPPRGSASPNQPPDAAGGQTAEDIIRHWPDLSRKTARALLEKYGPADASGPNALAWRGNGLWNKTVVYGRSTKYPRVDGEPAILRQIIGYRVPDDKLADLRRFDRRLVVDEAATEISFQSARESTNFLALNLADEIVHRRRTVAQARRFFRYAEQLRMSGKSSKYENGFLFRVRLSSLDYPE
jgi:hypothetical protein